MVTKQIPVLRPRLPTFERLAPYLKRIDASRIYSNFGPLCAELQTRLARHWAMPKGSVVCAASGTAALVGAVLASAGRAGEHRPFALTSAFTFVATAVAIEQCGFRPRLEDVDGETWMLDPERVTRRADLGRIAVVVPVAPFGRPVPQAQWRAFSERTGIPVVIDGAASFDRVSEAPRAYLGDIPVVFSLHATKAFGVGEGGCVASTDAELVLRAVRSLNFGFLASRDSLGPSINGKMSEYHAAVGLAELDGWPQKRDALQAVADCYRHMMTAADLGERLVASPDVSLGYALLRCRSAEEADRQQTHLRRGRIDTRLWYGKGVHRHGYFSDLGHDELQVADRLAPCLLGLPVAQDLEESHVARIVSALVDGFAALRESDDAEPSAHRRTSDGREHLHQAQRRRRSNQQPTQ
jgi:dTDP-4-amino-4,6-dideoxygalactose transaminase